MGTMLGRTQPTWDDMSADVVHVTRGATSEQSIQNLVTILNEGRLAAMNPFGVGRRICPDPSSQKAVCFTEVPVHRLSRIMERRLTQDPASWHGIGFTKSFIVSRGGGPIQYAYDGTPQAEAIRALMNTALQHPGPWTDPIWKLTPYVDTPGRHETYFFEWEREWRHVGDLHFQPADVSFLIIPEQYHDAAKQHFMEVLQQKRSGRAYFSYMIDARWPNERCQEVIRQIRAWQRRQV